MNCKIKLKEVTDQLLTEKRRNVMKQYYKRQEEDNKTGKWTKVIL